MPWSEVRLDPRDTAAFLARFRRSPRFLLDEDVTVDFAEYLREGKFNVLTVVEAGLGGRPDEEVFQLARRERRILVTRNARDFWDDRRFPLEQTSGIAVLGSERPEAAIYMLRLMGGKYGDLWRGMKIEFSANGEYRVKQRDAEIGQVATRRMRFRKPGVPEEWVD